MKQTVAGSSPSAGMFRAVGARPWWRNRLLVTLALLSMVLTGTIVAPASDIAWAKDYPSWADVMAARNDVAAKKVEIARLQALLAQLADEVATTEAFAKKKGDEFAKAQQAFDEQDYKTQQYQQQADAAQAKAETSMRRAGQMAARQSRTGGGDLTATLFFDGANAKDLLSQLGMANKITQQSQGLYAKAHVDQNTAQSLTDQANVAKAALKNLADIAQKARDEAQAAADAAAAALAEQQNNNARLKAQLATLESDQVHTEAEYIAGVKEQWGDGAGTGEISSYGWALPAAGGITDGFGYRVSPCSGCSSYHQGTDIGASCNHPIFAASTGEVVYAGWYGGYGNMVEINHGGGVHTRYGHIVSGGTLVHVGQLVGVGQQIARVGTTGASTGCHLHFEVRINGSAINSVPFMADRGITIG